MTRDRPETILLVDDSPANLRLLSQILADRGYRVRAATSGPRALASVGMEEPDLILLDIRMPEMDGYEVCRLLKADPATEDIPVLFISALDDIGDKVQAFSAGGVDYITKPFQVEEVVARAQTHLSLRRLRRDLEEANQRMEQELALAAQVQASFLPATLPRLPGWQLAVSLIPAQLTSGDFYDTVWLPGGSVAILVADVVDKGVGAALYMAMSSTLLRTSLAEHGGRPDFVCQAVNEALLQYATASQFVTAFIGILEPSSGTLVYSNAGHNPPVLCPQGPGDVRLLERTGLPLGAVPGSRWALERLEVRPGDTLVLYTDGITEAERAGEGFYGCDRLAQTVRQSAGRPAEAIQAAILDDVQEFVQGAALADDIALMVLVREKTLEL